MQIKFLKSIVENLTNKQSVPIVDLLVGKKDVNEFLIAKKLELTINQTRNILYKLSDYGLVSFIRKKDKRKGWYIYFWTLNIAKSLGLLEKKLQEELVHLEGQLKSRREKRYYICNTCSIEVTEEVALLNDFICSEYEEVYELSESDEVIKNLEKNISKLKRDIEFISEEREKEEEKVEKKKQKKQAKEEKIKKAERKAARAKNKKVAKNIKKAKKTIKKKAKKKVKAVKKKVKKVAKKISKKAKTVKKKLKSKKPNKISKPKKKSKKKK